MTTHIFTGTNEHDGKEILPMVSKRVLEIPHAVGFCKNCFRGRRHGSAYCGECQNEAPRKTIYVSDGRFPLLDRVMKKLKVKHEYEMDSVVFTYGDTIYSKVDMPAHLIAHEITHCFQQMVMGKDLWWDQYLKDNKFMVTQEAEAYRNQYLSAKNNNDKKGEFLLEKLATDLSGKLYGETLTFEEAKKLITS